MGEYKLGFAAMGEWKKEDISHVALVFLGYLARYSHLVDIDQVSRFAMEQVVKIINGDYPLPATLKGQAIEVVYMGPYLTTDFNMKNDKLTLALESEPQIIIRDYTRGVLLPSESSNFFTTAEAIAEEMGKVYKLRHSREPYTLQFPREFYAQTFATFRIPLLETSAQSN